MTIWRHLLGYLPTNIVSGLVSFGTVYAFTRLLSDADYGRYALVATGMHIAHTSFLTWSEASAYRFTAEADAKGEIANHLRTSLALAALSAVPALLMVLAAWLLTSDPGARAAIAWLAICLPAMSFVQVSLEVRKAQRNVARYSMVAISAALGGFAVGLLAAGVLKAGPASYFMGLAAASGTLAIVETASLWRASSGGRFDTARVRRYLAFGAPVAVSLLLEIALSAGDRFLIAYFVDEAAVGAYAAGYGVADQTIRLMCMWGAMAGAPLLLHAYENHGPDEIRNAGLGMIRMLLLVALPATVGIGVVAQPLADFMIGEDLRAQAARIMPWIAAAGLMNGLMIYYFSEAFQLTHRTGLRASLMIIPAVLNIGLNIVLLPRLGLMGAVYATVICYGLGVALIASVGRRFLPLPLAPLDALRAAIACIAMWLATRWLPQWGGAPELFFKAGVGALAFGLTAVALDAAGAREFARRAQKRQTGQTRPSTE